MKRYAMTHDEYGGIIDEVNPDGQYVLFDDHEAEIDRLQAIVDKLPVTADGVVVVPEMVLWCWIPPHLGQAEPYILESGAMLENGPCRPWSECYSTREAAEAAKESK